MRDGFIFYRSFAEAARTLEEKDKLRLYDAIIEYALDDVTPNIGGAVSGMFSLIKPQIDANNKRYENGRKGGRPRNQIETETKPNNNQTETKPEPKEKEKDKDKEKENVKDKVKEKAWVDGMIEPKYVDNLTAIRSKIAHVNERRNNESRDTYRPIG